jgi:C1A family cysteine protease
MQKTVALVTLGSAAALSRSSNFYEGKFFDWMQEHKKSFPNGAEFAKRLAIFAENLDFIDETNSQKLTYTLATNEFSHLTHEEFLDYMHLGSLRPPMLRRAADEVHVATGSNPASVDWSKNTAVVTPVKNQGNCGSCWSFSAIGAIEGAYGLKKGAQADGKGFSEQQLVSCDTTDAGCNGGWMDDAFDYVGKNNGVPTETTYPYTSGSSGASGSCQSGKTVVSGTDVTSHVDVAQSVSALESAVALTPVSIAIQANQKAFQSYSSGIITSGCGQRLDHGVLAVGYGTDNGTPYWKVKNSWGPTWGEAGYVRILKDSSNQCGVLSAASYPKL